MEVCYTTQINALWRIVHGRPTATVPKIERLDRNNVECVQEVRPSQRNFAEEEIYCYQAPGRAEATAGINSKVDVCEKANTTRNSSDKVV